MRKTHVGITLQRSKTSCVYWGHNFYLPRHERIYEDCFMKGQVENRIYDLWRAHFETLPRGSELFSTGRFGGRWKRCPRGVDAQVVEIIQEANDRVDAILSIDARGFDEEDQP